MSQHIITHIQHPGTEKVSPERINPFATNRERERDWKTETRQRESEGARENVLVQKTQATMVSYFTSLC